MSTLLLRGCGSLATILALSLLQPTAVLAVDNPDSISVESVRVFQNLWESGDVLFVIEYRVIYEDEPPVEASNLFLAAVYKDTTLLGVRPLKYYGHNVISVYFPSERAPLWKENYRVAVSGNPSYFMLAEDVNCDTFVVSAAHFVEAPHSDAAMYLGRWVITLAKRLELSWAAYDITLLTAEGKLNTEGAAIFQDAIPGLSQVCPDIFSVAVIRDVYGGEAGGSSYATALTGRTGTRLRESLDSLGGLVGVPGWAIGAVGFALLFFVLAGRVYVATNSTTAAVALSVPFLIAGILIGLVPLTAVFVGIFLLAVLFGIVFVIARFA